MNMKNPRMLVLLLAAGITMSSNTTFASEMMMKKEAKTEEPITMSMSKMKEASEDRLALEALLAAMNQEKQLLLDSLSKLETQHHEAKAAGNQEQMATLELAITTAKEALASKHSDIMTTMKALKKVVHMEISTETIMRNMKLKQEISKLNPDLKIMSPEDLYAKGHKFNLNAPPVMRSGEIMVPIKGMAEAFGASIEWHSETKKVIMMKGDMTVKLHLGSDIAHVNDVQMTLDQPAMSMRGNMYVPLKFMAEVLGIDAEYHESIEMIELKHKQADKTSQAH